jgi:hypothetical protein
MRQKPKEENAAYCYQRAEEARRMAKRTSHPTQKREQERLEHQWMALAEIYELQALDGNRTPNSLRTKSGIEVLT